MSATPDAGGDRAPATEVRQLPPRPSLEYERKEAKKLLRQLRAGDPTALARVRAQWQGDDSRDPSALRLADAQLTISREYGFASWPRLVSYFETLVRHERTPRSRNGLGLDFYQQEAESVIGRHRNRRLAVAELLATFVPRYYGRSPAEVFASTVTIDDARLLVARQQRYASWQVLVEAIQAERDARSREWERHRSPLRPALDAIRSSDLSELTALLEASPELVNQSIDGLTNTPALANAALLTELRSGTSEARSVTDLLVTHGADLAGTMGSMLCGRPSMPIADVERLLARGADPNWVAPNGYTALEHAFVRYWNGRAVDLLVAAGGRVRPAFWTAAALGDAGAVARYFNRDGTLTDAARKNRPDISALFLTAVPMVPDAPDVDLVWEAFFVAALNERFAVLNVLLDHGFPIDYMSWSQPMLYLAVGNRMVSLVEYLVRRGANLDVRGYHPDATPREVARSMFKDSPSGETRRILELCAAGDPEQLLWDREVERANPTLSVAVAVRQQIAVATAEAVRLGQSEVDPNNLFVAMFIVSGGLVAQTLTRAGADFDRLLAPIEDRIRAAQVPHAGATVSLPLSETVRTLFARTDAEVISRRKLTVTPWDLLATLAESESSLISTCFVAGGTTPARVREVALKMGSDL